MIQIDGLSGYALGLDVLILVLSAGEQEVGVLVNNPADDFLGKRAQQLMSAFACFNVTDLLSAYPADDQPKQRRKRVTMNQDNAFLGENGLASGDGAKDNTDCPCYRASGAFDKCSRFGEKMVW